jgi:hypothetical protein
MPKNKLQVLAGNRQFKIPNGNKVCGTYDVPQTLSRRSADTPADIPADVDCTESPTSIPENGF